MNTELLLLRGLGFIFGLVMLYLTITYYRRNAYTYQSLLVWLVAWTGFLFVMLFPGITEWFLEFFHVGRILDFLAIGGLLFFSMVVFYLYVVVKRTEKRVNELVSKIARESPRRPKK